MRLVRGQKVGGGEDGDLFQGREVAKPVLMDRPERSELGEVAVPEVFEWGIDQASNAVAWVRTESPLQLTAIR